MKSMLVEGWLFAPHSYSVVNQRQCVELSKIPGLRLKHRSMPPPPIKGWRTVKGMLPPDDQALIEALQPPEPDETFDVAMRIAVPYIMKPSPCAKRTFVFATAEFTVAEPQLFEGSLSAIIPGVLEMFTTSQWSKAGIVRAGAREEFVHVIPNGFNPDMFHPAAPQMREALRKAFGWDGHFVFLHVGAMTANKGIAPMLKAFAAVAAKHPEALLVMKGLDMLYDSKGTFKSAFMDSLTQAEALVVADRIRYSGETMPEADLATLHQGADAYLSPYMAEGFNIPVLEAAACGLPSICTAGGSTDDFTTPEFCLRIDSKQEVIASRGRIGLVPSIDSLVANMERAIADHAWREQARVNAASFAVANYTWKKVVEKLLDTMLPGWKA